MQTNMIKTQLRTDKLAIGLSMACVIHCFFAPAVVIFAYGVSAFTIESELIHYLLLMLAAPISLFALSIGYKNHQTISFLITGILGLTILILAVLLENILGESGERGFTIVGSMILAFSHYKNHRVCKELDCSECHKR